MMLLLKIEPAVRARHGEILLGAGEVRGVGAPANSQILEEEIESTSKWLRGAYSLDALKDEARCRAYRDFYWRMGIDPTKQRPAAEALARRILRGQSLPRINGVVDAYNLASLRTLVAIGAYDLETLGPTLTLRFSRMGEGFEPIGGAREELKEGQIVLADGSRIVHLYPYRDSKATCVTDRTRDVLVLSAGVPGLSRESVLEAARLACEMIERYVGGRLGRIWIVE